MINIKIDLGVGPSINISNTYNQRNIM